MKGFRIRRYSRPGSTCRYALITPRGEFAIAAETVSELLGVLACI